MIWNAQLYDEKHQFVSNHGREAVEFLQPAPGEKILDVGCGTGDLAYALHKKGIYATGVDHSPSMIREAKQKYPDMSFFVQDAHHLPYKEEFDAVFSNAALHWMKAPSQVLNSIFQSLKPGGRFVAEFGGKSNVKLISEAVINQIDGYDKKNFPWFFPTIGEYTCLMEQAGFQVLFAEHFKRPTRLDGVNGMENWIKMFGDVIMGEQTPEEKKRITQGAVTELKDFCFYEDHWVADYWRIRVAGLKKEQTAF